MFALAFRLNLNAKRPPGTYWLPGGKRIIIINNSSIMAEEQHILYVDLYDNPLTPKAGDYSGRVASTGSVQNTSIGTRIAAKRTEYRPETIANILDLSDQEKIEALAAGQTVNSKLGTLVLQVEGSFDGEQAPFDKTKHRLTVSFSMSKQLREALDRLQISTRSASSGLIINNVKDAESQELNGLITSGGSLIISGVNIKVAGDDEQNGVFLIPSEGEPIRARALVHNNPSQVTVLLPSLEDGEYTLSITTQYASGNRLLKSPRTATLNVPLYVGTKPDDEEEERPGGL